jgi:hypothetical protein
MSTIYELRYRPKGDTAEWSSWIGAGTSTSYTLTGLSAGTEYDVEVRAKGQTSAPAAASRWTRFAAPAAPSVGAVLAETATLTWTAVAGAAGYRVLRGGVPVPDSDVTISQSGGVVSATVSGLTEGTAYEFSLAVVNPDDDVSVATAAPSTTTLPLATGGTERTFDVGGTTYRVHTFADVGASTFTLNATREVRHLVVGGGGGGGGHIAGGGGGGEVIAGTTTRSPGTWALTVGAGGAGGKRDAGEPPTGVPAGDGASGGDSYAFGVTASGGGGGGNIYRVGLPGGSGGGGGSVSASGGGASTSSGDGAGNAGGRGSLIAQGGSQAVAGGGGGAGAVGGDADATAQSGGAGGDGTTSDITGGPVAYGGGGGGGVNAGDGGNPRLSRSAGQPGAGGAGGGGAGGPNPDAWSSTNAETAGRSGTDGTGGGGGGATGNGGLRPNETSGGRGGSGVVIVRYPL